MRRLIAGAQLMLLLALTSVVLTGCKDNEEERIRQALTDMGYMDGVSETDITAEAVQSAGEAFVSEAVSAAQNTAPPSETVSNPEASIPKLEELLPKPEEVLPKPEEVLPNPAEIFPDPAGI